MIPAQPIRRHESPRGRHRNHSYQTSRAHAPQASGRHAQRHAGQVVWIVVRNCVRAWRSLPDAEQEDKEALMQGSAAICPEGDASAMPDQEVSEDQRAWRTGGGRRQTRQIPRAAPESTSVAPKRMLQVFRYLRRVAGDHIRGAILICILRGNAYLFRRLYLSNSSGSDLPYHCTMFSTAASSEQKDGRSRHKSVGRDRYHVFLPHDGPLRRYESSTQRACENEREQRKLYLHVQLNYVLTRQVASF